MAAGLPSPATGTIWSSILHNASSSKTVPSKSVLVLGDAQSGKSTLANALRGAPERQAEDEASADLALSYSAAEVRDDEGAFSLP